MTAPAVRTRRIILAGGNVLELQGAVPVLIRPTVCPTCNAQVTADDSGGHGTTTLQALGSTDADLLVTRCPHSPRPE